jgi:hypothetical protein
MTPGTPTPPGAPTPPTPAPQPVPEPVPQPLPQPQELSQQQHELRWKRALSFCKQPTLQQQVSQQPPQLEPQVLTLPQLLALVPHPLVQLVVAQVLQQVSQQQFRWKRALSLCKQPGLQQQSISQPQPPPPPL